MEIKAYENNDENGWVRCRVLSFLNTAYFDNVLQEKEKYENPSIELVAVHEGQIVGLLDIEYETKESTVCSRGTGLGGIIWHIAVHPDYQQKGIGTRLLDKAEQISKKKNLNRLEAWTRDDDWVVSWYKNNGFLKVDSYLHVYLDGRAELEGNIKSNISKLFPLHTFAHYIGEEKEKMKAKFNRVHECICFEKMLK